MKKLILCVLILPVFSIAAVAQAKKIESVYTSLLVKDCKTIESNPDEGGSYLGECRGTAGYKLELLEGDIRQSVNIIAPNKKKFELDLWTTVSSAFSATGDRAEWRVVRTGKTITPIALILRFNAAENTEKPEQNTSYLVVAKITKTMACVTDVVKPTANQNVKARKLADSAADKPCLSKE